MDPILKTWTCQICKAKTLSVSHPIEQCYCGWTHWKEENKDGFGYD